MNALRLQQVIDWIIPLGYGLILLIFLPVSDALQFGGDEGYELMKALLVFRGYSLYGEIWNDQPPLHTELLAFLFHFTGPSLSAARLLTIAFAALLIVSLYDIIKERTGRCPAALAVLLLVSSSRFLELSVSAMLELPGAALGTASICAAAKYIKGANRLWLVTAGILLGCAFQTKLTTVIFVPAVVCTVLERRYTHPSKSMAGLLSLRNELLIVSGSVCLIFILVSLKSYHLGTLSVFFHTHFSSETYSAALGDRYRWRVELVAKEFVIVSALVGLIVLYLFGRLRDIVVPFILLLTAVCVHALNRPYWPYYILHFTIPAAWICGISCSKWLTAFRAKDHNLITYSKIRRVAQAFLFYLSVSLVLLFSARKTAVELLRLRNVERASESPVVRTLGLRAKETSWILTDERAAAFWLRLQIPPEIAIIPLKRIWSAQITKDILIRNLEQYRPEQVFIPLRWEKHFGLSEYLNRHYRREAQVGISSLYVRKSPS